MPPSEFTALLFSIEVAAVVLTALLLKRWMSPPPGFAGRYWRSLLACAASLPITAAALFAAALAVGVPADLSYAPGGVAGQFLAGSLGRTLVLWPFVIAWLVVKPRGLSPALQTPQPMAPSDAPAVAHGRDPLAGPDTAATAAPPVQADDRSPFVRIRDWYGSLTHKKRLIILGIALALSALPFVGWVFIAPWLVPWMIYLEYHRP